MKSLVFRDASGAVVHIGPWDFREDVTRTPRPKTPDGPVEFDEVRTATNPIPEGVTSQEEEIAERVDGGLAAADDHASLRRPAYPPLAEQLDAIWKGGDQLDAMRARVLDVKARFPKTVK